MDLSKAIYAQGKKAQIRVVGNISQFWNSPDEVQAKIDELKAQGITHADVYIRTYGGDPMESNETANILIAAFDSGTLELGAYVASAGTYLAVNLKKKWGNCKAPRNLQYMIHRPSGSLKGNYDQIESNIKLLKNIEADYLRSYAECTKLTEEQVIELWSKGDYWMNAEEAKKKDFITEYTDQDEKVMKAEHEGLDKAGFKIAAFGTPRETQHSKLNIQNSQKEDMELKAFAEACGLGADAGEAQVMAQVNKYKSDSQELARMKAQKVTEEKDTKNANVKSMTAQAIKDKKIKAAFAGTLEATASEMIEKGLDGEAHVKATLEAMVPAPNVTKGVQAPNLDADGNAKKWADYTPAELNAMSENDLDTFKALYKEEHGEEFKLRIED